MYFDNRFSTVLAWPASEDERTALRAFAQVCDLLSDERGLTQRTVALRQLVRLRDLMTAPQRNMLVSRQVDDRASQRLRRFFRLAPLVVPGPFSDLAQDHIAALAAPSTPPPIARPAAPVEQAVRTPASGQGGHHVGELISRIERFQDMRGRAEPADADGWFAWRSDANGLIVERGELPVSTSASRLTELVYDHRPEVLRALSRNTAFANQRGCFRNGGCFLLSGRPVFDPETGLFQGYRGLARQDGDASTMGVPAATVAEVAHEVRTPLNAILGYAEMIEQQILGPAPEPCRADARAIMADANRLLAAVDALGDAAALEEGRLGTDAAGSAPQMLADQLAASFAPLAEDRDIRIMFDVAPDSQPMAVEFQSLYRAMSRLLTALIAFTDAHEKIVVTLGQGNVEIKGPAALRGRDEKTLLSDVIQAPYESEAPLLGLAFTLRIMRRLAEANGGGFEIDRGDFRLSLPLSQIGPEARAS